MRRERLPEDATADHNHQYWVFALRIVPLLQWRGRSVVPLGR
jgi:hypothetical protein